MIVHTQFSTDMSAFLPRSPTPAQKILVDQVRDGVVSRLILVGVDGENAALEAIMNGTNYAATGLNNSDQIGRAAFHRIMGILAGGSPEKNTFS